MQCSSMSMMPPTYGGSVASHLPVAGFSAHSAMMDELSRQLCTIRNQQRQHPSRTSSQRHGNSMRVVKPRSANHSPYSTGSQGLTRPSPYESHHQAYQTQQPATEDMYAATTAYSTRSTRPSRPVSWHPSSSQFSQLPSYEMYGQQQYQTQPQAYMAQYQGTGYNDVNYFTSSQDFPHTPAVYSGYTSPATALSPLSLPYSTPYEQQAQQAQQQYFTQASWAVPPELSPAAPTLESPMDMLESTSTVSENSWSSYSQTYAACTAPPTPDNYAQAPYAEPKVQSEESIPYQPLMEEEQDDGGEVLYGLGLYDAPSKPSLLGSGLSCPPAGKGLKLESAWEPPTSEDEGDDDAEADN